MYRRRYYRPRRRFMKRRRKYNSKLARRNTQNWGLRNGAYLAIGLALLPTLLAVVKKHT